MLVPCAAAASAQHPGQVYISGGATLEHQEGVSDTFQAKVVAPGGTTLGWTAGGGVFLTRSISIEAGVQRTGQMDAFEVTDNAKPLMKGVAIDFSGAHFACTTP